MMRRVPAKPQYRCSCAVCSSCRNRDFHNSISAKIRRTTQLIQTPLSTIALTKSGCEMLPQRENLKLCVAHVWKKLILITYQAHLDYG